MSTRRKGKIPRQGYSSVTIKKDLNQRLQNYAEKKGLSIPKAIDLLLRNSKEA